MTLFVLTIASTTLVGAEHYAGYISDFGRQTVTFAPLLILQGFWYSGTILLILGAHELGHYLACRYYQVDASLPFFIPMPVVLTGTLGAFIRIREPIPTKRMLFDIGIAGPLAGFVFAVPALFIGIALSPVVQRARQTSFGFNLGEPLLFQAAAWLTWGPMPDGLLAEPASDGVRRVVRPARHGAESVSDRAARRRPHFLRRAWTAVDGRHALRRSCVAIGLTFFSTSWLVWTFLLVAMTLAMGPRHPRTIDEDIPLDPRAGLAGGRRAGHLRPLLYAKPDRADRLAGRPESCIHLRAELW